MLYLIIIMLNYQHCFLAINNFYLCYHLGVEKALIYAVFRPRNQRGQYPYPTTPKNGVEAILGRLQPFPQILLYQIAQRL